MSDEDRENSILTVRRQIFWLEHLEQFCDTSGIEFKIHNEKAKVFQSKVNELSSTGVMIRFDKLDKTETIDQLLKVYNTDENMENIKLFYWYIHKDEKFSIQGFIGFLKKTLEEYEQKGDNFGMKSSEC